ncbi:hypothetical protein M422DRAFT_266355 [Sphaerobolus stellatus SS14]|uniref:Uncharacterized protein n=1 Tax=Sphaerobolus stellatus (strain SS14) TaxID=990650 RepID=A0A0C9URP2_SPHS4|nr:hypothetical protein M422DRAFT_266355 [Sphaerobolus stellatus SS14]
MNNSDLTQQINAVFDLQGYAYTDAAAAEVKSEYFCEILMTYSQRLVSATSIVSLLSDTAVMVITAYYAFAVRRRLREIFANDAQSLVVIFFRQGVIRFVILFWWSLEISISEKTINPSLAGIDNDLKTAVSAILIYRFLLELRGFNEKTQNTGDRVTPVTLTSLKARISGLNDTFINEFGSEMNPEAEHVPEDGTNEPIAEGITV